MCPKRGHKHTKSRTQKMYRSRLLCLAYIARMQPCVSSYWRYCGKSSTKQHYIGRPAHGIPAFLLFTINHDMKLNGKENRRWWLVYVFVLPLALLWKMWKIMIFDLMTFHLWIFLQNGGMFMKVKSPGMLFNTIIIYICLSFQRGFPPHTWAEPGSTPRLPPFPCIPQTSAAPTKLPI